MSKFEFGVTIGMVIMFFIGWGVCWVMRRKTTLINAAKAEITKEVNKV